MQAGKSPAAVSVQLSGAQKNKVNNPGGGSFRYIQHLQHHPKSVCVRKFVRAAVGTAQAGSGARSGHDRVAVSASFHSFP